MQSGGKNFSYFPENQLTKFCASIGVTECSTDPIDTTDPPTHRTKLIVTRYNC